MDAEALYHQHAPALLAFLSARLPGPEAAEGLHQAVWGRVLAQPRELGSDHARRWLFTVAKNLLTDHWRRSESRPRSAGGDPAADADDPDDRLARLRECVARLSPDDRAVVEARFAGESSAEAAARLGVPPALADTRYRKAVDRLHAGGADPAVWVAATVPADPAALAGWLESRLVGPDLGRLVAELRAAVPPQNPPLRLDEVLGSAAGPILRGGLAAVPRPALRKLLRHPDLLLELQELVLIEGGAHWAALPVGEDFGRAVDRGWSRVRRAAAAEPPRPAAARPSRPPRPAGSGRRLLPYALTSLATAAAVLVGVFVGLSGRQDGDHRDLAAALAERDQRTRERDEARAAAEQAEARAKQVPAPAAGPPPGGWGWARADAFPADATRAAYLTALADRAEEWFQKRPDTPEDLARRLTEFRRGCAAVQFAAHAPLPEDDRAWLRDRCRAWSRRLDEQLTRLEETRDVPGTRDAADAAARQVVAALRARAAD